MGTSGFRFCPEEKSVGPGRASGGDRGLTKEYSVPSGRSGGSQRTDPYVADGQQNWTSDVAIAKAWITAGQEKMQFNLEFDAAG